MSTTDTDNQFLVMLGTCYENARLSGAWLRVELDDGTTVEGIPAATAEPTPGDAEVDHTGVRSELLLGSTSVPAARVAAYTVVRPA